MKKKKSCPKCWKTQFVFQSLLAVVPKDRPLEKWLRVGKIPPKKHARQNSRKKNSCRGVGRKKKIPAQEIKLPSPYPHYFSNGPSLTCHDRALPEKLLADDACITEHSAVWPRAQLSWSETAHAQHSVTLSGFPRLLFFLTRFQQLNEMDWILLSTSFSESLVYENCVLDMNMLRSPHN